MARKAERVILAEQELKSYAAYETAAETIPQRIEELKREAEGIRSSALSAVRVSGTKRNREDMLIYSIAKREHLTYELAAVRLWLAAAEKALEVLDEEERLILDRCYIHGGKGSIERLKDELHLEQSRIYERRDNALYKFTIAYYGKIGD